MLIKFEMIIFFTGALVLLITDLASLLSYPEEDWGCDSFQRSDVVLGNPFNKLLLAINHRMKLIGQLSVPFVVDTHVLILAFQPVGHAILFLW